MPERKSAKDSGTTSLLMMAMELSMTSKQFVCVCEVSTLNGYGVMLVPFMFFLDEKSLVRKNSDTFRSHLEISRVFYI